MAEEKSVESEAQEQIPQDLDSLPQGRYIPYSGGSMGWFENSGVLRGERGNNYGFHTVMQSEHVRSALFLRWGLQTDSAAARQTANENSVNRMMSDASVPATPFRMKTPWEEVEGTTRDISPYGMRMHFKRSLRLNLGDPVSVKLMGGVGSEVILELTAKVAWIKKAVVVQPVWFVGLAFQQLTKDTERLFGEFLAR